MRPPVPLLAAVAALLPLAARAEAPAVVADMAPVHSLVAQVMGDRGTPALLLPTGEPPHESGLAPSAAAALEGADLVVWTGPGLLPWLGDAIPALAPEAASLPLLEAPGWEPLPARAEARLDAPAPEGGEADPHAWLDPAVAAAWVDAIAAALAEADPEGAATYRANADAARAAILAQGEAIRARLAPVAGQPFAVGHDASRYWERATGLTPAWALVPARGGTVPASVVAGVEADLAAGAWTCLLADAETPPGLVEALAAMGARAVAWDPEGVALEPGPGLYAALLDGAAEAALDCLGG